MGWITEDGEHEGWTAIVFGDGRVSVGWGEGGVLVRHLSEDPSIGWSEVADPATAVGWRGLCECGWQGPVWHKAFSADQHSIEHRRVWDEDPSPYGDPPNWLAETIHLAWRDHLEPESILAIREATQAVRAAQGALEDAVRAARAENRSWTQIGEAAGMTRQSAHERWGKQQPPHEDESLPPQLREALEIMGKRGPVTELTFPTSAPTSAEETR